MSRLPRFSGWLAYLAVLVVMALGAATVLPAPHAAAANGDVLQTACTGFGSGATVCHDRTTDNPLIGKGGALTEVANLLSLIAGIMAVIFIIIGGIKYSTSSGDGSATASAKNTIIYGLIGLVVVIFARTIVGIIVANLK